MSSAIIEPNPMRRETTVPIPGSVREAAEFRRYIGHVSRHSSIYFAGTIFTAAASYFFKVYLARVLGAEALGIYALGMTIVGFAGVFNALGIPQSAVRFVASYSATGRFRELGAFLLTMSGLLVLVNLLLGGALALSVPWIALHVYHTPALSAYAWFFAAILLLTGLNYYFGQVLTGYQDVLRRTVISSFLFNPLFIVSTILLISLGAGLKGYLIAQVAASIVVLGLLLHCVWKKTPPAARFAFTRIHPIGSEVVAFSVAAFGISFLEFLMSQADKVLIGVYLDARDVGIYAVASAVVAFLPVLLQSVNQIFSPVIADLHARGERELLKRIFQTLTKWILAFTLPLALCVIIFARPLMGIFGREFEFGWPILVIGTVGQLANCGVGSVGYLLLMSGHQRRLFRIQATSAGVMLGLNLTLIPYFGLIGAAIASALTVAVCNVWCLKEVRAALGLSPHNASYIRLSVPLIATAAAGLLGRTLLGGLTPNWLAPALTIPAAYLVFCVTAVPGLDSDDRLIFDAIKARVRESLVSRAKTSFAREGAVLPGNIVDTSTQPQI